MPATARPDLLTPSGDGASALMERPAAPVQLADVQRPVEADLKAFERYFRQSMTGHGKLLGLVTRYVLRQKGKRIRPVLVLLAARAAGDVSEKTYRAAALVELMHTATLVHDDVVDEAERRRGLFSINALWKNKVAVLLGDFLLSRGLLLALDNGDYDMLHILSDAVRRMSEGELLQIEKTRHLDIDEATYFQIISDKTASLIAACTTAGARSATDDPDTIERFRHFGEKLGLAFQIRDDLFDFGADDVGKPLGIDLQEKKMTLPLIYALREGSAAERRRILKLMRKGQKSTGDVQAVGAFVEAHGGLAYARGEMLRLSEEAAGLLRDVPSSPARDALLALASYTVQRKV